MEDIEDIEIIDGDYENDDDDYDVDEPAQEEEQTQDKTLFTSHDETYQEFKTKSKTRQSMPYLTKYEKSRIIGIRAQQLSQGSPALVNTGNLIRTTDIALKELNEGKITFIIRRRFPNGEYEDWRVDELQ